MAKSNSFLFSLSQHSNRESANSHQEHQKGTRQLDSMLEDVIPSVVNAVRNWAEREEVGQEWRVERENGRRLVTELVPCSIMSSSLTRSLSFTNSANRFRGFGLFSIALTSRSAFAVWYPSLLQDLTVSVPTLPSIFHLLQKQPQLGRYVKLLKIRESVLAATDGSTSFPHGVGRPPSF